MEVLYVGKYIAKLIIILWKSGRTSLIERASF